MEKKKFFKTVKGIFYSLFGLSGAYKVATGIQEYKSLKVVATQDSTEENTLGYSDIKLLDNRVVHNNNFVIFHIDNNTNIAMLTNKIEYCNEHNISVGLVLDTDAHDLGTIYKEVDIIQAIVKEYTIDLPVYFNIDGIMNSRELNAVERKEIMTAFSDKMNRSDMYYGFHGTESNLVLCTDYVMDITPYDCYLVEDNSNLEYKGTAHVRKDLYGNIVSSIDLSEVILGKNLNSGSELVFSSKYEVKEGETFHSLALVHGLSEEDLRNYNNNIKEELVAGDVIVIPNLYATYNTVGGNVTYKNAVSRGIDISNYQENFDWNRIAETSDYVIVQVARDYADYEEEGTYLDTVGTHVKNTIDHNLDLGLYFCVPEGMKVSYYEERIEKYFDNFDEEMKELGVVINREEVPVFLDFEVYYEYNDYYHLMNLFEAAANRHGFTKVGIYGNANTLSKISSSLIKNDEHIEIKDTNWFVWQAGGPQYSATENTDKVGVTIDTLEEVENSVNEQYTPHVQQVTNVCKDTGASNFYGNCDVNYCYSNDVFGDDNVELDDNIVESVVVDIDQYKGLNPQQIADQVANTFVLAGFIVLSISIIRKAIVVKIQKKKEKVKTLEKK